MRSTALLTLIAVAIAMTSSLVAAAPPDAPEPPGDRWRCPREDSSGLHVQRLEGLRVHRAREVARSHNCFLRIVRRNGDWIDATDDFDGRRINITVRDRRVKQVLGTY